jgi:hypothetical protein
MYESLIITISVGASEHILTDFTQHGEGLPRIAIVRRRQSVLGITVYWSVRDARGMSCRLTEKQEG